MGKTAKNAPNVEGDPVGQSEPKTAVKAAKLPEVNPEPASVATAQFDILLDMEIPVTVVLGQTQLPVHRLLKLGPGAVIQLGKAADAPVDLYLQDTKFAEADVVVVGDHLGVRIRQIVADVRDTNQQDDVAK